MLMVAFNRHQRAAIVAGGKTGVFGSQHRRAHATAFRWRQTMRGSTALRVQAWVIINKAKA